MIFKRLKEVHTATMEVMYLKSEPKVVKQGVQQSGSGNAFLVIIFYN